MCAPFRHVDLLLGSTHSTSAGEVAQLDHKRETPVGCLLVSPEGQLSATVFSTCATRERLLVGGCLRPSTRQSAFPYTGRMGWRYRRSRARPFLVAFARSSRRTGRSRARDPFSRTPALRRAALSRVIAAKPFDNLTKMACAVGPGNSEWGAEGEGGEGQAD